MSPTLLDCVAKSKRQRHAQKKNRLSFKADLSGAEWIIEYAL